MMDPIAATSASVETPAGLSELAAAFDGYIVDLWGVLHDGYTPFPGSVECLERLIAAGTLAQRYEALGGRVRWHGKPYPSVYHTCFGLLGEGVARERILAIGDSLRTDIAGANGVAIKSLLISGGIHAEEFGLAEGD